MPNLSKFYLDDETYKKVMENKDANKFVKQAIKEKLERVDKKRKALMEEIGDVKTVTTFCMLCGNDAPEGKKIKHDLEKHKLATISMLNALRSQGKSLEDLAGYVNIDGKKATVEQIKELLNIK